MTRGEKLRELRKANHMTLEAVAKHINVGRATVLKYEDGTITNIPSDKIEALAKLFNVNPGYLMGWSDKYQSAHSLVIPDNDKFLKVVQAMTAEDYYLVMDAFERTYQRMKANGEID